MRAHCISEKRRYYCGSDLLRELCQGAYISCPHNFTYVLPLFCAPLFSSSHPSFNLFSSISTCVFRSFTRSFSHPSSFAATSRLFFFSSISFSMRAISADCVERWVEALVRRVSADVLSSTTAFKAAFARLRRPATTLSCDGGVTVILYVTCFSLNQEYSLSNEKTIAHGTDPTRNLPVIGFWWQSTRTLSVTMVTPSSLSAVIPKAMSKLFVSTEYSTTEPPAPI
mmetsp:Transcript_48158/g.145471  ORF Transcript_48158/g.145471 Transcript_48158/m.145471 type:complete len:226 (-) Transcript_48158:501-1178(-)